MKQNERRRKALPVTALFLDIGSILFTNGVGRLLERMTPEWRSV
jgi:hypothetical protein